MTILPRPRSQRALPGTWQAVPGGFQALQDLTLSAPLPEWLKDEEDSSLSKQGYILTLEGRDARLRYASPAGRWYGLMTLKQILREVHEGEAIESLEIRDEPRFAGRGAMLDISRLRVPTLDFAKIMVDLLSELKFNQLQLYTEHTFAFQGHETVWKDASPFTGEDIEELDAYCGDRNIELVPNQNTFGHMERWLRHDAYKHLAECPEGFVDPWGVFRPEGSTLDPSNPGSLKFVGSLLDQLLPHFTSRNLNIGGDEPFELGQGRSKALCDAQGTTEVYLEFLNSVAADVERRGFRAQFWADIILNRPDLLSKVPENALVMNWGYEDDHPFPKETAELAKSGREFWVCPGTASWNSLAGRWTLAKENIRLAAEQGLKHGASGLLITDWGDNGHKQAPVVSLPGWFAGAAAAWNGPDGTEEDIRRALQIHVFGDEEGKEARALLELGDLYRENTVKIHNMSFLFLPLVDHHFPYCRNQYRSISQAGMGASGSIAAKWAQEDFGNTSTWHQQLQFTASLMSFAVDLAEAFYAQEDTKIEAIPKEIRRDLARRLEELISQYAIEWKKTCRVGGLQESLEGFAGVLDLLKDE